MPRLRTMNFCMQTLEHGLMEKGEIGLEMGPGINLHTLYAIQYSTQIAAERFGTSNLVVQDHWLSPPATQARLGIASRPSLNVQQAATAILNLKRWTYLINSTFAMPPDNSTHGQQAGYEWPLWIAAFYFWQIILLVVCECYVFYALVITMCFGGCGIAPGDP